MQLIGGGSTPSQIQAEGVPHPRCPGGGGYPIPGPGGGVPIQLMGGGTPSQVQVGYPDQGLDGVPPPPSRTGWGTPCFIHKYTQS